MITVTATRNIQRTLGTYRAARYLFNRNVPLETALYWLTGRASC